MFSAYKDKIDDLYDSLQEDFNIDDNREIKKHPEIELDRRQDGPIHIRQSFFAQSIINMFPAMDKSSANPKPAVKPP